MLNVSKKELQIIKKILSQYVSEYEIWAFGSRVTGTHKEFSDLDLAIMTDKPIDFNVLAHLRDGFAESNLPYKVDIIDWSTTSNEFREIIQKKYQIL